MNEEIFKRIRKQNEFLFNYLCSNSVDDKSASADYLYENYFLGNRKRFVHQLNDALENKL
jgi:hypothetical protein